MKFRLDTTPPEKHLNTMSPTAPESKLESLQCHFTWDLDCSGSRLLRLRDKLEDIGTEKDNYWLGHIYNLWGFFRYKLDPTEDALSLFNKAAEALCENRGAEEGPWLVVNYGNLAWLHHHLGDQAESQAYLSKVDALMKKYPPPSQDELHAEVYAEKAWTLMKFDADKKALAADYFQRAFRMQPDRVEWNSSYLIGLAKDEKYNDTVLEDDILQKMRMATDLDPENLYLAVLYLDQRARKGERVDDEVRELAREVLRKPFSSYSGLEPLLRIYRNFLSVDEAIDLAEEALEKHPDVRFLKRCAALCYKWKIIFFGDSQPDQSMIDRAISLHKEVIALYPRTSLLKKIDLANIYARSNHSQDKSEPMFEELLQSDLKPEDKQMIYNYYAKYLNFVRQDRDGSIEYHMKAVAIPIQSYYRRNSIRTLEKIKDRGRSRMCREIESFLTLQKEPQSF